MSTDTKGFTQKVRLEDLESALEATVPGHLREYNSSSDLIFKGISTLAAADFLGEKMIADYGLEKDSLKGLPKEKWRGRIVQMLSRHFEERDFLSFGRILELYHKGKLSPVVRINGKARDGINRAVFCYLLGVEVVVAEYDMPKKRL